MTDERRSLVTDREREILLNNGEDVNEGYYGVVGTRARSRIQRLETDIQALKKHPTLYDELLEFIPDRDRPGGRFCTEKKDPVLDSLQTLGVGLAPKPEGENVLTIHRSRWAPRPLPRPMRPRR